MSEIRVCTDDEQASIPEDIVICGEESTEEPSDIRICEGAADPCEGVTDAPVITSPASGALISNGQTVTISGGTQPYSVTYSGGTASQSSPTQWTITIDACSVSGEIAGGTIEVTDACGNTDSVDVRNNVAGGAWVIVSDPARGTYFRGWNYGCASKYDNVRPCNSGVSLRIEGYLRIRESWQCLETNAQYPLCPNNDGPYITPTVANCQPCSDVGIPYITHQSGYRTEEWQCP